MRPARYLTNTVGGLLTGFISGGISGIGLFELSVHWPQLGDYDTFILFLPGAIFGTAISVYFWLFCSRRSLLKAFGFIVICTATEIAMFVFAALVSMALGQSNSRWVSFINPRFLGMITGIFFAGTVGAFLVMLAALFLFCIKRGRRVALTALSWSLLVGVLAVIGVAFGIFASVRLALLTGLYTLNMFAFVFLAWQTSMGFVLGLISQCNDYRLDSTDIGKGHIHL